MSCRIIVISLQKHVFIDLIQWSLPAIYCVWTTKCFPLPNMYVITISKQKKTTSRRFLIVCLDILSFFFSCLLELISVQPCFSYAGPNKSTPLLRFLCRFHQVMSLWAQANDSVHKCMYPVRVYGHFQFLLSWPHTSSDLTLLLVLSCSPHSHSYCSFCSHVPLAFILLSCSPHVCVCVCVCVSVCICVCCVCERVCRAYAV